MSVPAWLLDAFAAVMLLVAAVSATRLTIAARAGRLGGLADPDADIDVSHLLMGIAMAGTLVAALTALPSTAWEVVFALLTVWFAARVVREYRGGHGLRALVSEHHAPHLLHSAAMLYMFLALRPPARTGAADSASPAMSGMNPAGLRLPTLALLFAFLLVAYVVADLDRVPAPRALATPAPAIVPALVPAGPPLTPELSMAASTPATPPTPANPGTSKTPDAPETSLLASRLLSPGIARGCRIAMGVTMAFMLIIMI